MKFTLLHRTSHQYCPTSHVDAICISISYNVYTQPHKTWPKPDNKTSHSIANPTRSTILRVPHIPSTANTHQSRKATCEQNYIENEMTIGNKYAGFRACLNLCSASCFKCGFGQATDVHFVPNYLRFSSRDILSFSSQIIKNCLHSKSLVLQYCRFHSKPWILHMRCSCHFMRIALHYLDHHIFIHSCLRVPHYLKHNKYKKSVVKTSPLHASHANIVGPKPFERLILFIQWLKEHQYMFGRMTKTKKC